MSQRSHHFPKLLANVYMIHFKGSFQFLFLCKPQKSGVIWVYSMFPQITQKILATDTFHWLVVIHNSQPSIDIQSEKNNDSVFLTFQKICNKITRKVYILRLWKLIKDTTRRYLHCMCCFFLTLETVFSFI